MSQLRQGAPGATRECPHCKTTILKSAVVCPSCRHHVRFDANASTQASASAETFVPLKVEGEIRHPEDAPPWEYCVVVSIRNERGEETARKVVGVGAVSADEARSFTLTVEATPVAGKPGSKGRVWH